MIRPNYLVMARHITRTFQPLPAAALAAALVLGMSIAALVVGSPSVAAAGFTGTADSANARFVVDGYEQLLGRSADTSGLDFHLARLTSGGQRSRHAFTYSMLFGTEGSRQEVRRAYAALLERPVDPAGESYWTNHLKGHDVLDLRVLLISSDEYWRGSGGSDQQWLEALYRDTLGRASDQAGRQYWTGLIEAGVARPLIAAGLYRSDEALRRRVDSYYDETLNRSPSPAERSAAVHTIRSRGERDLRAELWASDERFEDYLQAALS